MKKYIVISILALVLSFSIAGQSQARCLCLDKIKLINEVESIVEQIACINERYDVMKNAAPTAMDVVMIEMLQQERKQVLINLAVVKINQIQ